MDNAKLTQTFRQLGAEELDVVGAVPQLILTVDETNLATVAAAFGQSFRTLADAADYIRRQLPILNIGYPVNLEERRFNVYIRRQ